MASQTGFGQQRAQPAQRGEKGFVDKAWDAQERLQKRMHRIGSGRYARVLKMARKPEPDEFRRTAMITGAGLFVIGLVGFVIFLLMEMLSAALGIQ